MIELRDKSILQRDPAIIAFAFMCGDCSPFTLATIREMLSDAVMRDTNTPLHDALEVPRSGKAWRLHCRNLLLRGAAMQLDARKFTNTRQLALEMQRHAVPFILQSAPAWEALPCGIPSGATELDRLLFLAYRTGEKPPAGLREWQRIISSKV